MDPVFEIPGVLPLWQSVSGGAPEIRIAIIDGPVDDTHRALRGARLTIDHTGLGAARTVRSEHGTHVTSVLMGQPEGPVRGIAPNCTTTVFSIYREGDDGELEPSSQAALALAINRAVADGARIINISSGQQTPTGQAERILADAARTAARAGALIVAAAGNNGCRCLQVPAALDSVLAVGACDLSGRPLPFSNFGDGYLENGILAPGELVNGASPREDVALRSGTSFAAPIVTGIVALLLARLRKSGLDANPRAVRAALLASAIPCTSGPGAESMRCLAGRLNVPGTVAALIGAETDAPQGVSQPRAPPAALESQRHQNQVFSNFTPSSEDTMGDLSSVAASAPHILGPDGRAVAGASAVTPSEARPEPSAPQAGTPPEVRGAAAVETLMTSASPHPVVLPMGANTVWIPVSMSGAAGPGWGLAPASAVTPPAAPPQATVPAAMVEPAVQGRGTSALQTSVAGCGCGSVRPSQVPAIQLAFPIGRLYYDFGNEARLDYFVQAIANWRDNLGDTEFGAHRDKGADVAAPYDPEIMGRYLLNYPRGGQRGAPINLQDADAIIWTLTIDSIPIYAIKPLDVFGLAFYTNLVTALFNQEVSPDSPRALRPPQTPVPAERRREPSGERVTFAGWQTGTTKLLNGTVVPTLTSDWRGFYQWDISILLGEGVEPPEGFRGFLERIYNEFRNVGISPQDRALNYSAINAYNTKTIFREMAREYRLDTVEIDPSAICRPDSICFEVTYRFFNPLEVLTRARKVFQYTIDVSDTVPVAVGPLRRWEVY
jgi:cyanobactin maturation PatA/PatG family protease